MKKNISRSRAVARVALIALCVSAVSGGVFATQSAIAADTPVTI